MKNRALVSYPKYGLANRLRAIASAKIFAEHTGRKLFVNWAPSKQCNVRWEELFITPLDPYPLPSSSFQVGIDLYDDDIDPDSFSREIPPLLALNRSDVVAVRCCQNFQLPEMTAEAYAAAKSFFYRSLQPVEAVQKAVSDMHRRYFEGHNVVGIHIRRTDHLSFDWRDHELLCPTDLFIEAMERILKTDPETKFFLSTDDKEEEKLIMRRFPGAVIVHEKEEVRRDTKGGMQDALIDWLLLSSTSRIIGSYRSSFNREAAAVNEIKIEFVLRSAELTGIHYRAAVKRILADSTIRFKRILAGSTRRFKKLFRKHIKRPFNAYSRPRYRVLKEEGLRKFLLYAYRYRRKQIFGWIREKISRHK
jgi:hypothetical protein